MSSGAGQGGIRSSAEGPVGKDARRRRQTTTSKRLQAEERRVDSQGYQTQKGIDLIDWNGWAERQFQEITREMIDASGHDEVRLSKVLANCAYKINASVGTIKRYVVKYCSDEGPFRLGPGGRSIGLNPYWKPPLQYLAPKPETEDEDESDD